MRRARTAEAPETVEAERYEIDRPLDLQIAVLRCQRSALLSGATDLERSVIATIVSELSSNVLKYAGRGTLEMRRYPRGLDADIEITVVDAGPGIADVELALQDHYSSGRTLGLGLPGVRRMADAFEITRSDGGGTTVRVSKRVSGHAPRLVRPTAPDRSTRVSASGAGWSAAGTVRPRSGQTMGGDAVAIAERGSHVLLAIVDVTGHGGAAHALALTLSEHLRERFRVTPDPTDVASLLRALHDLCVGTIGAAAGLALLDVSSGLVRYLAVGNVRAAVVGATRFTGVSRDGVLGRRWPTPFVQAAKVERGDVVILWTDGLPESLARKQAVPRAGTGSPAVRRIADELMAGFGTWHDDAACLVARLRP
jgi:anti-sigma regulatory factor (Ser/Thr protein kinase)